MWNTIKTYNTMQFSVSLQWRYEDAPDLSWCDSATLAGIESGRYSAYCFRVVVLKNGHEIGAEYLGESIYENPTDFGREHYRGNSYFPNMVRSAIADARHTLNWPHHY